VLTVEYLEVFNLSSSVWSSSRTQRTALARGALVQKLRTDVQTSSVRTYARTHGGRKRRVMAMAGVLRRRRLSATVPSVHAMSSHSRDDGKRPRDGHDEDSDKRVASSAKRRRAREEENSSSSSSESRHPSDRKQKRRRSKSKKKKRKRHYSSDSSSSSDESEERHRRKKHHKRDKKKRRKKEKKKRSSKRRDNDSSDSDNGEEVRRSIITGKKIKMKIDKTREDVAQDEARKNFLKFMNQSVE
jgi:hypothetical protein